MGYDMKQIHQIFEEANIAKTAEQKQEINLFSHYIEDFQFTDNSDLNMADKALMYYIAGYISKSSMSVYK